MLRSAFALFAALIACEGGSGTLGSGEAGTSSGTNPNATIDPSQFARDCTAASDCMAVRSGNVCNPCTCPSAAIAKKDRDAFSRRLQELQQTCPPQGDVVCGGDCADLALACTSGTCALGDRPPPVTDASSD